MPAAKKSAKRAPARKREQRTKGARAASAARKATAAKAEAKAKAAGATGRRVTGSRRTARDLSIIAWLTAGATAKEAGAKFGVGERTVNSIVREYRGRSSALDRLPMEIVEGLVRDYQAMIATFHEAASEAESTRDLIAALRQARETMADFVTLMDALGKLPSNLEAFVQTERLRTMARRMAELVEQVIEGEVPAVQLRAFLLELAQPQTPGSRRELPSAG